MKYFRLLLILLFPVCAFAQQPNPAEREKQMYEMIEKEVEKYTSSLELEDWQTFYVDSILTHDYSAMMEELDSKSKVMVSNSDIYQQIQDKWMETMYNSFRGILDDRQWAKYLKQGAARDKKARDKRAQKRNGK